MIDSDKERKSILPSVKLFEKTNESWEAVKDSIQVLNSELLSFTNDEPLLGSLVDGEYVTSYPSWKDAFLSEDTTILLMEDGRSGKVIGYTFAIPEGKLDPRRAGEIDTAYIYATAIEKEHQGQGLVGKLTDALFKELAKNGYMFVERDAMVGGGYADSIQRHYASFIIGEPFDYDPFGEGLERHFRIDAQEYVAQLK